MLFWRFILASRYYRLRKTPHYLRDVAFGGRVVNMNELDQESLESLTSNFTSNYIADCEEHRKYAVNQFYGLKKYLENIE